jgi:probable rRNA maturation factor
MNTSPSIRFINEGLAFTLKEKKRIRRWLLSAVRSEKQLAGELCYVFCSDEHLREMNKKFLAHNYYTDILSFDYTEADGKNAKKQKVSGEMLISLDRVRENAKDLKIHFDEELKRVMIHGLLHLLGYADKSPAEKAKMRKKEDTYLANY